MRAIFLPADLVERAEAGGKLIGLENAATALATGILADLIGDPQNFTDYASGYLPEAASA